MSAKGGVALTGHDVQVRPDTRDRGPAPSAYPCVTERFESWCHVCEDRDPDGCGDTTFVAQVEETDAGGALEVRVREAHCERCAEDVTEEVQGVVLECLAGGLALPWGLAPIPEYADAEVWW